MKKEFSERFSREPAKSIDALPDAFELGPIDEKYIAWAEKQERATQILLYSRMIDAYQELFHLVKESEKNGVGMHQHMDLDRTRLHRQIERVGLLLNRSKDLVLGDILSREGNLAEYDLPEYGLITPEQTRHQYNFPGQRINARNANNMFGAEDGELGSIARRFDVPREFYEEGGEAIVPGIGERQVSFRLKEGQLGILFGMEFTVDILQEPIQITPPGFQEKFRRAQLAKEALEEAGLTAELLYSTAGAYHDTQTIVGIAVDAKNLDPHVVGLLRNHRSVYGIREEDMDKEIIHADYEQAVKKEIEAFTRALTGFKRSYMMEELRDLATQQGWQEEDFYQVWKSVQAKIDASENNLFQDVPERLIPPSQKTEIQTVVSEKVKKTLDKFTSKFYKIHRSYFGDRVPSSK